MTQEKVQDCFTSAEKDEQKGRKHKGLLFVKPNLEEAKGFIEYDDEFIKRIQVYKQKEELSDVDEREKGRYSSLIQMKSVLREYDEMTALCRRAVSQCEEIVFSGKMFTVPEEIKAEIKREMIKFSGATTDRVTK